MAEYEHQLKVIDEAHKIFVVREMIPKDIKREYLAGPRKFEAGDHRQRNDCRRRTSADGSVERRHDTKTTQSNSGMSNDMSFEDVRAIAWKVYKAGKGARKKLPNGSGTWHRGKGADEWTSGRRDDGAKKGGKKGSKGSTPDWHGDQDKGGNGGKGKGKGKDKGKNETRYCYDCGEQGHIGVNCPYKWANSIVEEGDQTSSCESDPEGENAEELASLETPDEEGEWCWPKMGRVTRCGRRIDPRPAFHYFAEDDEGKQAPGGLNQLVSRSVGGAQWTWKKVTVVVDSGAAQNVMPRSMFPEIGIRQTESPLEWKRVQRTRRRGHQEIWAASHVRQDP